MDIIPICNKAIIPMIGLILFTSLNCNNAVSENSSSSAIDAEIQCQQFIQQAKFDQAIEISQIGILQSTDIQSIKLLICKGTALEKQGKSDQSLQAYSQALDLAKSINAPALSVLVLKKQADLFILGNHYEQSQKVLTEAWRIVQTLEDKDLTENVLNSLAIVYYETEKYDQAERYFVELVNLKDDKTDPADFATTLFNLAHVYGSKNEFEKANEAYAKSLQISKDINSIEGVAYTLKSWGVNLHAQGRLQGAEEKLHLALELFTELGYLRQQATTLRNLADIEMENHQYSQAIDHYRQALPILKKQGFNNALMRTYRGLTTAYAMTSSFELAYENSQNYTHLLKQYLEEKNIKVTQELQVAFETQRFQADNERLATENREHQNKLLHHEQVLQMQNIGIVLVMVILTLIIFMWRRSLKQSEEMEKLASTDELTKLQNRRSIIRFGEEELYRVQRFKHNFSLLLLDIDFFKKVNDTYGHSVGDEVLQLTATILSGVIRKTDRIGRYGGEEFLILAPETNAAQAMHLAERVRLAVEAAKCNSALKIKISVSIGIASYIPESNGSELGDLIDNADKALYEAKDNGRNQSRAYSS